MPDVSCTACIDQSAIAASLSALPIYLAACDELVVLAGATFPTRLWCVIEVKRRLRSSNTGHFSALPLPPRWRLYLSQRAEAPFLNEFPWKN